MCVMLSGVALSLYYPKYLLNYFLLRAFFESVIRHNKGENEFRWKCIFLPDNGAFFVNYVVTSALIGTALELMRYLYMNDE